ncbi:hypothetical protein CEUSTIGMA_g9229.t1 [Chlamydomonas eustigma]|uniref:THIF-type NAD/FAD binding fold domain-containing protein n=1 Tax=Chlamydomonas eustigma TaxID=1157962 RepID=A0A250XFE6_9CHLO|nr:hypothetical protein CEUSTIGMA_g9229.t1 [Chlamydomonas eustigma]|eukprot:GAX81801.1 hypothetical protein CEUSTIGMA_g9229.t1 [Chlamydomonas eustigma]
MNAQLTTDESAVYDRQLRVWGLEVQQRLNSAKILIIGGNGIAAEVSKNLTLAGAGLVAIADDTPCGQDKPGNFLISDDSPATSTVAEACACTLQAMNPLIKVKVEAGPHSDTGLKDLELEQYDTVVATDMNFLQIQDLEARCIRLKKQLFACLLRGAFGVTFVNLNSHSYREKAADGQSFESKTLIYSNLEGAMSCPVAKLNKRTHPLYLVSRAVYHFELLNKRSATSMDLPSLQEIAAKLFKSDEVPPNAMYCKANLDLLEAWASHEGVLAPVAAILGGVVANHVIRAVSFEGPPIKNMFYFSLFDNLGVVEDMHV